MATRSIPTYQVVTDYTQAQEDNLATSLSANSGAVIIFNITLNQTRVWTGASFISIPNVSVAQLGSGSPSSSNYLRGDGSWYAFASLKADLGLVGTNSGDQTITLTGDVTGSGTGNFATTIKSSISLTTPIIGVATGTSLATTGPITSSGGGIGYTVGAGGSVTQLTNRTTGVILSKLSGAITTNNTSLAALAAATFTVTNTLVAATDVIKVCIKSGAVNVKTDVRVTAVAAGSFNITVHNIDASTAETGAIVINFVVIKAVIS